MNHDQYLASVAEAWSAYRGTVFLAYDVEKMLALAAQVVLDGHKRQRENNERQVSTSP